MSVILRPDQWWARYQADPQGVDAVLGCGERAERYGVFGCGAMMQAGQQLGDMLGVPVANVKQSRLLIWLVRHPESSPVHEVAAELGVDVQWVRSRVEWLRADYGGVLKSHVAKMHLSGVNVLGVPRVDRQVTVDAVCAKDWTMVAALTGWSVNAVETVTGALSWA